MILAFPWLCLGVKCEAKYKNSLKPGTPEHGNVKCGTLAEQRNSSRTGEHWWNTGTLAEQLEYHGIAEQESINRTMEQQSNTKKRYKYRATIY